MCKYQRQSMGKLRGHRTGKAKFTHNRQPNKKERRVRLEVSTALTKLQTSQICQAGLGLNKENWGLLQVQLLQENQISRDNE